MGNRFRIILSNQNLYKEIELTPDMQTLRVGTALECDVRLHKEWFFEPVDLRFQKNNDNWDLFCSDNVYIALGDVRKLTTKQLEHGDILEIKYQQSDSEAFSLEFLIDFGSESIKYERAIDISESNSILIGNTESANIVIGGKYIKNDEIVLTNNNGKYALTIKNTTYGVYHNGKKAVNKEIIRNGDFFSISDYFFYLKDGILWTEIKNTGINGLEYEDVIEPDNYPKFNRNTRIKTKLNLTDIEILDPPNPPSKPQGNIVLQLLPAIVMLILTIVVRGFMGSGNSSFIIFSACSMGIGIITSIAAIISDRKKFKKDTEERIVKYNKYIDNKKKEIESYREDELTRLNAISIDLDDEIRNVDEFSGNLFDKVETDEDFLNIRIGSGTVDAQRKIAFKKQERFETEDELANLPANVYNDYKTISNAPITVDFKQEGVIGVIGDDSSNYSFVKNMVVDLCSRHYYKDVQLFMLVDDDSVGLYKEWARWLPHAYNSKLDTRNIVHDDESRSQVFEYLYVELGNRSQQKDLSKEPQFVVYVLCDWGIKTHPVSQFIENASDLNTTFVFFEHKKEELPLACKKIITLDSDSSGSMINADCKDEVTEFSFKKVYDDDLKRIAVKMAPIYCEEINLENTLTKNITLFELLNIMEAEDINLAENWDNYSTIKSMSAPIGVKTKGEVVYLDLHEKSHGPHGLVAGTTGSGKSEILQTYILSMATLYHPYEVGFVIIDFKGGGMANQFEDLPHLIGTITNIDGHEINRSLMSIKAELERRQRLFAENDVNNINNYIKLFKAGKTSVPIPHLIIVVDEFAELKAEQPEFMKELISAARIGRSLGVHLILATQKPAGQVNDQIWSNSRFKLCLKVQTKEDSNEVLKSPLAAEIKEPGRAYLQVGNNEIFELFQSAYSGAPSRIEDSISDKGFSISEVNLHGKHRVVFQKVARSQNSVISTQLDSIVERIRNFCEQEKIKDLPNICLPPLKDVIEYNGCKKTQSLNPIIPIGVYDDPSHQAQNQAMLNIAAGNTVIIGSSQYGKTNLLQLIVRSLAENYTPEEVALYILDFGSMALRTFDNLNHVGGVVTQSEDERVKNLFRLLSREISSRKEKFAQLGITSHNAYIEAGYKDIPQIVLMIDNFIGFKELYPDYEDDILTISREGLSLGISIIVTSSQTNGISYKYMSNFSNRVGLFCNSSDEYGVLFDRCRMEPKAVPGRCLLQIDKQVYEAQTYLAFSGEREIDRVKVIQEFVEQSNKKNAGMHANVVPSIPKLLDKAYVSKMSTSLKPYQTTVGLDYESIEFQNIDLAHIGTIGITGREKSGKTNFAKLIFDYCLESVFDFPTKAYIVDDYEHQLEQFSSYGFVEKYTVDVSALDVIIPEIEAELQHRKELVQKSGIDFLNEEPLIVCAIENQSVFDSESISKDTVDAYKRIVSNYKQFKVLFIFTNIPNVNIPYNASEMLKQVKELNIMYIMDDLANVKLIDLSAATMRQYKKPIELGDSYQVLTDGSIAKIRVVKSSEGSE